MDNTTINIRTSKIIEQLIAIVLSVVLGGAALVVWTASTEQEDRIKEAVSQVEAKLTAIIEVNMEHMKAGSDEIKILRDEIKRIHLELLALHNDDKVMNAPYLPKQKTFDHKNYKNSINIKQEHYYQQKR